MGTGKPTGTSVRFADLAANAIHEHVSRHGYSVQSVEKIALEGEGRINERIDILCLFFVSTYLLFFAKNE